MVFNDNAMLQNYDLSINRATERLNYFVSGSFYDQDGIAQGSTFRRYSMRANAEVKASNWLKVGTNSMVAYEEVEQADQGSYSLSSPISACRFMLPYWNPYNPDGSLATNANGGWTGTTVNPIEWMDNNPVTNKKYKVLSVLFAEVTPNREHDLPCTDSVRLYALYRIHAIIPELSVEQRSGSSRSSVERYS